MAIMKFQAKGMMQIRILALRDPRDWVASLQSNKLFERNQVKERCPHLEKIN